MLFAAGAVGAAAVGALDLLSSLTPDKSNAAKTGVKQTNSLFDLGTTTTATNTTTVSSTTPTQSGALSPSTLNALLSAQDSDGKTSRADALKDLFAQIDTNGDGKITKAEFEDKLGAGGTNIAAADNVFDKMDADGDGSVTLGEMGSALKKGGHRAHHAGGGGGGGADALMQALQGASSTSTTNSDGSITTTLTYADGSTVTLSQPASATTSTGASTQYNLVERLIQRQADALASSAKQSVSVKV